MENKRGFIMRNGTCIGMDVQRVYTSTPIGIIQAFSGTTIPRGFLLCDGASYPTTEYPDLYAVIGNTYGGDSTNFNVPNLVDKFIQGSTTSGTEKEAGLPNITGSIGNNSESHAIFYAPITNGAFTPNKNAKLAGGGSVTGEWYASASFDASKSNAIYGNSDTVQPPALTMVYIIKAFHTNEGVDEGVSDDVVEYVEGEIDALISDTSSETSTYSSKKIDEEIDKNAIENQIENALNCIDITNHALRLAIVSKDYKTLVFRGKTYNCYDSIAVAIDTEYELITSAYQLGLAVIVMEGTYTECIRLYGKENISIVGVNKYKCKIVNKETDTENGYYYPPLWINPSTTVMNLTIQCLTSRNIRDAYCIHTDDDGTGKVLIKNCILHCSQHACIGFGTRQDAPLFIEDCDMINDYYNAKGVLLYGHNACSQNTTREEVHVTRCYGRTAMGYPLDFFNANWYYPTGTRGSLPWLLYFNDNTFYQRNNEIPTTITVSTGYTEESEDKINFISGGMMRMPSNSGNNIETLNYPYQNVIENVLPVNIEFNTDYFTTIDSSVSKYEVRNGICYVTMDVTGVASGGGQTVCKLPKPSIPQMQFSIPPYNDASAACVGAILYNNGNLTTFSVRAGQRYMCSFSYPIV